MPLIEATVEVNVSLEDFDTDDLLEELKERGAKLETIGLPDGYDPVEGRSTAQLADALYEARRNGNDARALELCDRLIYAAIGRIV
ncbi:MULTISPECIES: hypothetical protein [unclassified Halomonas]|uniref:hypothetical protein n=1 Tax=unclassified Halomonas TaxID=2609666 RepID=UPI002076A1FF|nr:MULTISPECIES: hypothetical protein [unclassified Halomonas]